MSSSSDFDFGVSETWARAYGLVEDTRPQADTPSPIVSVSLIREIYHLDSLRIEAHFRMIEGNYADQACRQIARAKAESAVRYLNIFSGHDVYIVRFFTKKNDNPGYFWVEYYLMEEQK